MTQRGSSIDSSVTVTRRYGTVANWYRNDLAMYDMHSFSPNVQLSVSLQIYYCNIPISQCTLP